MALCLIMVLSMGAVALADTYEVAMITDIGTINDKSFNQSTWEGIQNYCNANDKTFNYYQPSGPSTELYLEKIDQAVTDGAKIIVTPGFLFEEPIYIAQDKYPEIKFVLLDGAPHSADYSDYRTNDNTVSIVYAEEQSGYLAGYAAVYEGNTKLGFMGGMAVPAVVRFGYGFVQGADDAAQAMNIDEITINYYYTGGFDATPEAQARAASWYNDGVEVIFACGGAVGNSVMAAAEAAGKKVIGVDVDQSYESETVITSATKGLAESVEQMLDLFYKGEFPGGQNLNLGAKDNGVGLPMGTSKFETFTDHVYRELYDALVDGSITIQTNEDVESADKLTVDVAKVTVIE